MYIRQATFADLPRLMEIYSSARAFMRSQGNLAQWTGGYPASSVVAEGIARGEQWVVCDDPFAGGDDGRVVATFWFAVCVEPTYAQIFDGRWLTEDNFSPPPAPLQGAANGFLQNPKYGVVHRLASDGSASGVGAFALRWALEKCGGSDSGSEDNFSSKVRRFGAERSGEGEDSTKRTDSTEKREGVEDACFSRKTSLRVDTHRDNAVMQSLLRREGFTHCGTIFLADGSPRDAFELVVPVATVAEAKKLLRERIRAARVSHAEKSDAGGGQNEHHECQPSAGRGGGLKASQKPGSEDNFSSKVLRCCADRGFVASDSTERTAEGTKQGGVTDECFSRKTIGLYIALPDEAPTAELLAKWLGEKRLALPVVLPAEPAENREPRMVFREYTGPKCLHRGAFGIPEPRDTPLVEAREIDVMLVPGVAFDRSGGRLGRGGGFYDRYLSAPEAAHIRKIGLCPPHALVPAVPAEPHDVRMDEIVVCR